MDKAELAKLYAEAGTLKALGETLGVSLGTARSRLLRAGIPLKDARTATARSERTPKSPPSAEARADWQRRYDEAGSVSELARRIGKSVDTVRHHLRRHGVEIRRSGFVAPRTAPTPLGAAHHNWKGGKVLHSDGYVLVYAPWHPAGRNAKGYVLEHRLVMERRLGRYLTPQELVHHENEVKVDNSPENLELMSRSRHNSLHKEGFPRDSCGRFTTFGERSDQD